MEGAGEEILQKMVKKQDGKFLPYLKIERAAGENPGGKTESSGIHIRLSHEHYQADQILGFYSCDNGKYGWVYPDMTHDTAGSDHVVHFHITDDVFEKGGMLTGKLFQTAGTVIFRPVFFMGIKESDDLGLLTKSYKFEYIVEREDGKRVFVPIEEGEDWEEILGKNDSQSPTLLMIHGTNGTSKIAFGELINSPEMDVLFVHYGDRILSFGHPSIWHGVSRNVDNLIDFLEDKALGPIDILTRSRGCLVARWLLEMRDFNEDTIAPGNYVRRLVMLCGPNQGTPSSTGLMNKLRTAAFVTPLLRQLSRELGDEDRRGEAIDIEEVEESLSDDLTRLLILLGKSSADQGARDMAVNGPFLKTLNNAEKKSGLPAYYAISSSLKLQREIWSPQTEAHERLLEGLDEFLGLTFGTVSRDANNRRVKEVIPHDGILPTYGAFGQLEPDESTRLNLNFTSTYMLRRSPFANHLNYMRVEEVRQAIVYYLTGEKGFMVEEIDGFLDHEEIDSHLGRI